MCWRHKKAFWWTLRRFRPSLHFEMRLRINGIKAVQQTFRFLHVREPKSFGPPYPLLGRLLLGGPMYFSGSATNVRYCPKTLYFRSLHALFDSLFGYEGLRRVT